MLSEVFAGLAAQERYVLGLLLTNRKAAEPIVKAAGLTVDHFSQPDHRVIFLAWEVACDHDSDLLRTLQMVRFAIRHANLWDKSAAECSTGCWHSNRTIARLATSPMPEEELLELTGGMPDGRRRAIARHVVSLVEAATALGGFSA